MTKTITKDKQAAETTPKDTKVEEIEAALAQERAAREAAETENAALKAELAKAQKSTVADAKPDNRDKLLVRSANNKEFWRGGILFTGDWQEVERAVVGETAWERIVNEPALQHKEVK